MDVSNYPLISIHDWFTYRLYVISNYEVHLCRNRTWIFYENGPYDQRCVIIITRLHDDWWYNRKMAWRHYCMKAAGWKWSHDGMVVWCQVGGTFGALVCFRHDISIYLFTKTDFQWFLPFREGRTNGWTYRSTRSPSWTHLKLHCRNGPTVTKLNRGKWIAVGNSVADEVSFSSCKKGPLTYGQGLTPILSHVPNLCQIDFCL